MEEYRERLEAALRERFPDSRLELEELPGGRISGYLIWAGFTGERQIDRQTSMWDALEKRLPAKELDRISVLLTVTPDELAVMDVEVA